VVGFRRLAGSEERSWITHLRDSKSGSSGMPKKELRRLLGMVYTGEHVDPTRMTLRTWLAKWLDAVQQEVSPRTYERYGEIVKNFLIPALGESCSNQAHAIPYSGGIQPMGKGRPPRWQVRRLVAAHAPLHPCHTQIRS
jgi:hypothetical protein